MASKSIDIIISTVLKKTGIDAARSALSSLTKNVKDFASGVGRNLTNIKSAFEMVAQGARTFLSVMSKGMEFERMTTQFKSLTGSIELARAHMKDLQDLGRTPPFSLEQFAAASQAMMKMTGGMAGFKKEMEIVGDMAAATGNDIATVGRAFGLAYQVIRDGQDFGRAGQQLYSLGIMTKKQVAEFAELSKAGTDNAAVWEKLQEVFGRYKGAMAETEKTTKGLVEAIQGEATVAMTDFSSAISESAKPALAGLLDYLKRINEDGSIEEWADGAVEALGSVGRTAKEVGDAISWVWKALKTIGAKPSALKAGLDKADELGLKGKEKEEYARKFQKDVVDEIWGKNQTANEDRESLRQARAERKRKNREEQTAKSDAEAERRKNEDYAAAQKKKNDERRAANFDEYKASGSADTFDKWLENKAKADAKSLTDAKTEYAKYLKEAGIAETTADDIDAGDAAFVKWRENRDKKTAQEIADAKKIAAEKVSAEKEAEAEIHKQRVADLNAEANIAKANMDATERTIDSAKTEFDKAFAMYRSEDKGAAQIAEERDYAADYKQLQKDANRYGGKWRIDELSSLIATGDTQGQQAKLEEWRKSKSFTPEVESMVRAAAADQTRTTAEDELRKISNNTENLAKKLDELLQVK